MTNPSGITPDEFKVLIAPKEAAEKIGSLYIPEETKEKEKFAATEGVIVAVSPLAFLYVTEEERAQYNAPKRQVGDRVIYTKYGGVRVRGRDGKDYLLIADKDIHATIEE